MCSETDNNYIANLSADTATDACLRKACPADKAANCGGNFVRVEINANELRRLLESGMLNAVNVRCLDCDLKSFVWKLCLELCGKSLHCRNIHPPDG